MNYALLRDSITNFGE